MGRSDGIDAPKRQRRRETSPAGVFFRARGPTLFLALTGCALFIAMAAGIVPRNAAGRGNAAETDFQAALSLYHRGQWRAAADNAAALDSADGYGLAARATLVRGGYGLTGEAAQRDALDRALAYARQGLEKDPDHPEANLQAAAALGYRARFANSLGDARQAKTHIDRTLAAHPGNAWAHAALGAWHGEVVLGAGPVLGRLFFGATREKARAAFAEARRLAPDSIAVLFNEAQIRLRFGKPRDVAHALDTLRTIAALPPDHAFADLLKGHADLVLAHSPKDTPGLIASVESVLPFRGDES